MSTDDEPIFPGPAEDVTTAEGMSVDDAVASPHIDDHRPRPQMESPKVKENLSVNI